MLPISPITTENAVIKAEELTFSHYSEVFINELSLSRSMNTILSYKQVLSRAANVWGELPISDISKAMVKSYINNLNMVYRHKTVCLHFDLLRNLFRTAVEDDLIEASPMQNLTKPKRCKDDNTDDTLKAYSEEQIKYILKCFDKEKLEFKAIIYFLTDTGCRRGEICGLTWDSIDLITGEVIIRYNAQYFPGEGVRILSPKSGRKRRILLNNAALRVMREWDLAQTKWCMMKGIQKCKFCFNDSKGGILSPATLTSMFRIWGKKHGIANFRPHRLRHSMATISIANGADVISVSKKLGHSSPAITLSVYSHANEEAQRKANELLAKAIYQD